MSRSYIPRALRERVAEQGHHRCGYCLTPESIVGTPMEIDHIIPEALRGPTEEQNLWLTCSQCNQRKGNKVLALDPESGEVVGLFNPRDDRWAEHFAWNAEGDLIIGLTPVGRATILALSLNRMPLVYSRRIWVAAGWHPPSDI